MPRVWPGRPYPLGATWDGAGVNFALFSEHATKVELCLFDAAGRRQGDAPDRAAGADRPGLARLPARRPARASSTATASTARTSRPTGHRFNPNKVVLDPYAKADRPRPARGTTRCSATRSARGRRPVVRRPRQRRVRPAGGGRRHRLHLGRRPPAADPVAQDAHLRAARQGVHQAACPACRRSSAAPTPAWRREAAIQHLQDLGVTAVELLPVHHHLDDRHLVEKGLTQLLGLQHARLLRPGAALRRREQPPAGRSSEFKTMVRALHAAGIEVILDVVYNHTAEGNQLGPTLSLPRHRQRRLLPPRRRRTRGTTWTSPAAATP